MEKEVQNPTYKKDNMTIDLNDEVMSFGEKTQDPVAQFNDIKTNSSESKCDPEAQEISGRFDLLRASLVQFGAHTHLYPFCEQLPKNNTPRNLYTKYYGHQSKKTIYDLGCVQTRI